MLHKAAIVPDLLSLSVQIFTIVLNGPILWIGSASMGFSKSRVEDEWHGETHSSASDSQDCHSWKIEKVASGGRIKLEIDNVLVME